MVELSLWGLVLGSQCDAHGESAWGWVAYPSVMLYCFYLLARICDGHLTLALEFIVQRLKMSEDVAGATFLAMASSAPELFCSIVSTFVLVSASGVGNIVGSAVFNLLVIIGVTPIFAGGSLNIWWYPTMRDAFFYSVAILEIFVFMHDGLVYWYEGLVMVISYAFYVLYFTQNQRICRHFNLKPPDKASSYVEEPPEAKQEAGVKEKEQEQDEERRHQQGGTGETEETDDPGNATCDGAVGQNDFNLKGRGPRRSERSSTIMKVVPAPHEEEQVPGLPGDEDGEGESGPCKYEPVMLFLSMTMPNQPEWLYTLFMLCCFWIGVFTYLAVDTAGRLGCLMTMPDVVMGLVFLAAGTSVPDAMGSVAVARDGMGDMAVANAVGSNTFDILIGLGLPWLLKASITGEPVAVPTESLQEAILLLACCLVGYLVAIMKNRWALTRNLGFVLLALYVCVISWFLVRHYVSF